MTEILYIIFAGAVAAALVAGWLCIRVKLSIP